MIYSVSLKVVKEDYRQFLNDAPLYAAEPSVKILGGSEHLFKAGSVLNLTCIVTGPPSRRPVTAWIHNDQIVLPQPGVSLLTDNSPHTSINTLIIHRVAERHAGPYRCAPGNLSRDVVSMDIF